MGATERRVEDPSRMHEATEATPLMAAYFLGALRDQSSRANAFHRKMRWQRMRAALATEEELVAEAHLLGEATTWRSSSVPEVAPDVAVMSTAELPAPCRAAAG